MTQFKKLCCLACLAGWLQACSSSLTQFDCPVATGITCQSIVQINRLIDQSEDSKKQGVDHVIT